MNKSIRIGLIGDHCADVRAHVAIPKALELAADQLSSSVEATWLHTGSINGPATLADFTSFWCVPNSPYANMEAALGAIRFARENKRPFLGTCGGFQHALIEYARNFVGMPDADHAESNPAATMPLIAPLSCSLAGATGTIHLDNGSRTAQLCQALELTEEYHCNFGLNPRFKSLLDHGALKITGWDENGETRIVELAGHPFFIATLFQPELQALKGKVHPLIVEFVRVSSIIN